MHDYARRLVSVMQPRGIVLCYHRVGEPECDPQALAVSPRNFAAHLDLLCSHCQPMSLATLVARAQHHRLPRRAVAITLDDGYSDAFTQALPFLGQRGLTATVFVTSAFLTGEAAPYWDDLALLLILPNRLPTQFAARIGSQPFAWATDANGRAPLAVRRAWSVLQRTDPDPWCGLYRTLCDRLRPLPDRERACLVASVQSWSGLAARPERPFPQPRDLARPGLERVLTIGTHTHRHESLAHLPTGEQVATWQHSRRLLQEWTGQEVEQGAYPYGGPGDVDAGAERCAREAGVTLACSTHASWVAGRERPMAVPRFTVRDWNAVAFHTWLRSCWRGT